VLDPPCIRHRPFAIAGALHDAPQRVHARQRWQDCASGRVSRQSGRRCTGLFLAFSGIPHPSYLWRNRSNDRLSALIDRNVLHRDIFQKPDLQSDGLRAYAARAGLDIIQDYCDVGVSGRREGRPQLNALMAAARNREIDCVLVWKFDRFARSTRHLLAALEEFNHLGVRFVSVQDQIDTDSPMGRAMFTIIGAMAELESSLISERVTAGMRAAEIRGKHLGRPATQQRIIREIETLATSTDLSIRQIQSKLAGRASRGIVGEITKRARAAGLAAL
jgi:DNA invertase Pin-like site-specific DNA recombinase